MIRVMVAAVFLADADQEAGLMEVVVLRVSVHQ
jgi:hypothetical protein